MRVKGSVTVEAAFIIPLFMFIFCVSVTCLFYAHDKVIIGAAAHETLVVQSGEDSPKVEEIEKYFQEQIKGKTILFEKIEVKVEETDELLTMFCTGKRRGMKTTIMRKASVTEPENYIRSIRKIGGILK